MCDHDGLELHKGTEKFCMRCIQEGIDNVKEMFEHYGTCEPLEAIDREKGTYQGFRVEQKGECTIVYVPRKFCTVVLEDCENTHIEMSRENGGLTIELISSDFPCHKIADTKEWLEKLQ